jgi:hypothetical protein
MPGDICTAATATPLSLDAQRNVFTLGKTPDEMPGIAVIFQNWKKIQKPKLQSNASVLLRWQHAARHSSPSTRVEETSSMQGRIAPQLLHWGRTAMRSHSLSCQRTLQHAMGDCPCIAALARRSSTIWGGERNPPVCKGHCPSIAALATCCKALPPLKNIHYNQHQHQPLHPHLCLPLHLHPHLDSR